MIANGRILNYVPVKYRSMQVLTILSCDGIRGLRKVLANCEDGSSPMLHAVGVMLGSEFHELKKAI